MARIEQHDVPAGFLMGGFECTTHQLRHGRRIDIALETRHDVFAASDYRLAIDHGLRSLRDGIGWYRIEPTPRCYDWTSAQRLLDAARATGAHMVWDLLHFGWPDWTDPFDPAFCDRFAEFAWRFARLAGPGGWYVPVNEISFLSWIGGELGHFAPHLTGSGDALKHALCRAAIAAIRAIRDADPAAVIMLSEPLIHVHPGAGDDGRAARHNAAQFHSTEIILGLTKPELGGDRLLVDIVGCNYYAHNQWLSDAPDTPLPRALHRPLASLLADAAARLNKPLLLSETGTEGDGRAEWFAHVCEEVRGARHAGVDVRGVCLYPLLNHLSWDNQRYCAHGLFCGLDPAGRRVHRPLAREIERQAAGFADDDATTSSRCHAVPVRHAPADPLRTAVSSAL